MIAGGVEGIPGMSPATGGIAGRCGKWARSFAVHRGGQLEADDFAAPKTWLP